MASSVVSRHVPFSWLGWVVAAVSSRAMDGFRRKRFLLRSVFQPFNFMTWSSAAAWM